MSCHMTSLTRRKKISTFPKLWKILGDREAVKGQVHALDQQHGPACVNLSSYEYLLITCYN